MKSFLIPRKQLVNSFFTEILKMCVPFMFHVIKNLFNRDLSLKTQYLIY